MRLLLDTHVVLWALGDPDRIAQAARDAIVDPGNDIAVSAVTAWEIAIKRPLGKLTLPGGVADWLLPAVEDLGATWLPISAHEAAAVELLPLHHRDPFDRMLVAQAMAGTWTIVTADAVFAEYPAPVLSA